MPTVTRYLNPILALSFSTAGSLLAQAPEEIVVVGVVPAGAALERSKVPYPVQTGSASDLLAMGRISLADYMESSFTSVSLNAAQNNPLQADLQYRGFTASPLLGLSQGLVVYQNGSRVNEPLGDTVNWDLLPQSAIQNITLSGGANPLFGLNSLGGSLNVRMKDGFSFEGSGVDFSTGAFGRHTASVETGGNDGKLSYYANVEYFDEDGWRDQSASEALNFYGSVGWRSEVTRLALNYQHGDSELVGNGAAPVELLALNRAAIFTGPDITANNMSMLSLEFATTLGDGLDFGGNVFYRRNETDSFNGDGSEFSVCGFTGGGGLIEGLEDDDLAELGFDDEDVCDGQFDDALALENFLNDSAMAAGTGETFSIEGFEDDELSGSGLLSASAINNQSRRDQESQGADIQWTLRGLFLGLQGQAIAGAAYTLGQTRFDAVLELSDIDPLTRITTGLGTGTFVDEAATLVDTETESTSLYATSALDLSDNLALTVSARANDTRVSLNDLSGERPELNGSHRFNGFNPALGLTWQLRPEHNLYASISRATRAPTPIELACNEGVFERAVEFALADGEDPDDVDFECRLPNAFLADPPLDKVVATSIESGARGFIGEFAYTFGVFHTTNRDDILFQTTGRQTGLFANVDKTRRAGVETSLAGQSRNLNWRLAYSLIDATFADDFRVLSPNHSFTDADGEINVADGDRIPGIPRHQFKLVSNYTLASRLVLGLGIVANSDQYLRGDESNQLSPIKGYMALNLRASYRIGDRLEVYGRINNALDAEYETFGLLGEEPNELEVPVIEDLSVPIFLGAAPPRAAFIGIRARF